MYQGLDLFNTAAAMARHAGARQAMTARNVANADTPGFRAQTMPSFSDIHQQTKGMTLHTTRAGHLQPMGRSMGAATDIARSEPSPNGNSVSIEEEMLNAVAISREHNRALMIYRHGMTVLRTTLGR